MINYKHIVLLTLVVAPVLADLAFRTTKAPDGAASSGLAEQVPTGAAPSSEGAMATSSQMAVSSAPMPDPSTLTQGIDPTPALDPTPPGGSEAPPAPPPPPSMPAPVSPPPALPPAPTAQGGISGAMAPASSAEQSPPRL